MDETNMTLGDFVEYAEIYPYSQDRFYIEKTMMELKLIELHLESYNFIIGNDLSLDQLDVMMVESGPNDMSIKTEEIYTEKVNSVINGIRKILNIVRRSLKTLFSKSKKIFTATVKEDSIKMQTIKELSNSISNNEIVKDKITNEYIEKISAIFSDFEKQYHSFSTEKGSKILVSNGISRDDSVFNILNFAANTAGGITKNNCACMAKLSSGNEYDVIGPKILNEFERLTNSITTLSIDMKDTKKLISKLNEIDKEIKALTRSNTSFKIYNEDEWDSKLNAVKNLDQLEEFMKKCNEDSTANSRLISKINEIVVDLQEASANIVFAITNHINIRKKAIEDRNKIIKILNELK